MDKHGPLNAELAGGGANAVFWSAACGAIYGDFWPKLGQKSFDLLLVVFLRQIDPLGDVIRPLQREVVVREGRDGPVERPGFSYFWPLAPKLAPNTLAQHGIGRDE
jgi:hypothetical protein